jgi:hypothetical protein
MMQQYRVLHFTNQLPHLIGNRFGQHLRALFSGDMDPPEDYSAAILRNEFGYNEEVDPKAGDDWDFIFGGYPHCGDERFDWKMETGLNKFLTEEQ